MKPLRIFVLYEYGSDLRPHGSSSLRLLRPLSHPRISQEVNLFSGSEYTGELVDIVIVDRLWKPEVSIDIVEHLAAIVRKANAKLIYSLDDNFFDIPDDHVDKPAASKIAVVEYLLREADGILVTSPNLQNRIIEYNARIEVVPQALDERLLLFRQPKETHFHYRSQKLVVGYMGTLTHDDDLLMILPALKFIAEKYPQVEYQIIGAIGKSDTRYELRDLPMKYFSTGPGEEEYPLFMIWYTSGIDWDIALAPLQENAFNRSKSDIKFLDYCAIGASGVFSDLPPYHSSVKNGESGYLVSNDSESWINAIELLINKDDIRTQIARNASHYLYSQRTLFTCATLWLQALQHHV